MRAIISGVTPKVEVFNKESVDSFIKSEKSRFLSVKNKKILYSGKTLINTSGLNYLNLIPECKVGTAVKNLILKEYYDCEKMYPYGGDIFLEMFFGKINSRKILGRFCKNDQDKFKKSITDKNVKNVISWIIDNISLERNINIQNHSGKNILMELEENFVFSFSYDYDFYNSMSNVSFRNYKFIIIDGYIESIGEIHHLLTKASVNKIPYVIFCYGMSEEVKHNIMVNNKRQITKILPVSLDSNDENTLNILNDIAVLHDSFVVTSKMGQTISQEVSKDLREGNKITLFPGKIYIDPVCSEAKIKSHKKFLNTRLEDAKKKIDVNLTPIENRIKNFSLKRLNMYVPNDLKINNQFQRDLSYSLNFLKNIRLPMLILDFDRKQYYVPTIYFNQISKKTKSLKNIIDSIDIVLT